MGGVVEGSVLGMVLFPEDMVANCLGYTLNHMYNFQNKLGANDRSNESIETLIYFVERRKGRKGRQAKGLVWTPCLLETKRWAAVSGKRRTMQADTGHSG